MTTQISSNEDFNDHGGPELDLSVVILSAIYGAFLLGVIALNLGLLG